MYSNLFIEHPEFLKLRSGLAKTTPFISLRRLLERSLDNHSRVDVILLVPVWKRHTHISSELSVLTRKHRHGDVTPLGRAVPCRRHVTNELFLVEVKHMIEIGVIPLNSLGVSFCIDQKS